MSPHRIFLSVISALICLSAAAATRFDHVSWLPIEKVKKRAKVVLLDKTPSDPTVNIAVKELQKYWDGPEVRLSLSKSESLPADDGYTIARDADNGVKISARSTLGLLYGAYDLLRNPDFEGTVSEKPFYKYRILNHWDNLDGTIERGYAGKSLWKWAELPNRLSPRYQEYARANAAIGINGTVLNNVNASPQMLSRKYLVKVAALADIFRPYGIKVYLSVNFASPMVLDSLPTADPLDPAVREWWEKKADEIYNLISDFGGFLVKANSEGQPGPMDFGRTHADGANMLAKALKPHDGIVMWRAFVYSPIDADRAKQAYMEFQPLDGKFDSNVIIQIKNGPIDFQPREPYSPLFGAMPSTDQMAEFQITQEYLGHSNHLAFLAPMWTEFFRYVNPRSLKAIAGVTNIGDNANWTGHPLAQANWYAFGRLAWNPSLTAREIAGDWITKNLVDISKTPVGVVQNLIDMFTTSHETVVDYMMPLGLHHIFAFGHHYGPEPWCDVPGARPDWLPKYYHQADSAGLGFDRSPSGSNAVEQYPEPLRSQLADMSTCPEEFLLWFHHVPWDRQLSSGRTLWEELCHAYQQGCDNMEKYEEIWKEARPYIDPEIYADVKKRLDTQTRDAKWWRDACLLYFSQFSGMPPTKEVGKPAHSLEHYKNIKLPISNYECPTPKLLDSVR